MHLLRYIIVLCTVLVSGLLYYRAEAQKKYYVTQIDSEIGMPQSSVYAMMKDSKGFVWLGTSQSLSRFDGNRVRNFTSVSRGAGLTTGRMIRAIVEDTDPHLWLSISDALVRFDRKTERFTFLKQRIGKNLEYVFGWPIAVKGSGVWCIAPNTGELFYYDYQTHKKRVILTNIPYFNDTYLLLNNTVFDGKTGIWVHLTEGLMYFDLNTLHTSYFFSKHSQNLAGPPLSANAFTVKNDTLLIETSSGALALHIPSRRYRVAQKKLGLGITPNSVISFPPNSLVPFTDFGDGIIWVQHAHGIYKLSPVLPKFNKITPISHPKFNNDPSVRSINSLSDSIVRIGTRHNNYLYNRRSKQFLQALPTDALVSIPGKLTPAPNGDYWLLSSKGLCLYTARTRTTAYFTNPDTLTPETKWANYIFKVIETSPNTLLVSTESGLFIFNKQDKKYQRIPFFGDHPTRFPLQDREGRLYIRMDSTLHIGRLKGTNWLPETTKKQGYFFRNGFEDTLHHVIWGAAWNGLKMIRKKDWSIKVWTKKDGLIDSYIYDVLVDKKGDVWFSTNKGISRLNLTTKKVDNFRLSDGLQSLEFNSNTAHITADGEFFFGGVRGFNHFYPEDIKINTRPAIPILTDFKVREQPYKLPAQVGETSDIQLSPEDNTFSIDYSAIDFFSSGQNTYQYRLSGLDDHWINAEAQTTARFGQVPPGNYTFELKVANNDGIWNNTPRQLRIVVPPPMTGTLWFRALMILLLLAGLYGLYRYRLFQVYQKQRLELEVTIKTQEAERQRFAKELHDGIGANLATLKLYLSAFDNPKIPLAELSQRASLLLDTSVVELRQLSHNLSPRTLTQLGLVEAIRKITTDIGLSHHELRIDFEHDELPESMEEIKRINLYRIVQELLQNTLKHAQATQISIELRHLNYQIQLHYQDNGRGFTSHQTTHGNGLTNIESRAMLLNGKLQIDTSPGKGFKILIEIPI
jgi:signal transduction histidine kinase/ligand-binding sensor domain-containing protein